jgi:hypothetical protein
LASAHREIDLGRDNHFVAAREIPQCAPEDFLARALGIPVRGIEKIDPRFQGALDEGTTGLFVQAPGVARACLAKAHASKTDPRYIQPGGAQFPVFHDLFLQQRAFNHNMIENL